MRTWFDMDYDDRLQAVYASTREGLLPTEIADRYRTTRDIVTRFAAREGLMVNHARVRHSTDEPAIGFIRDELWGCSDDEKRRRIFERAQRGARERLVQIASEKQQDAVRLGYFPPQFTQATEKQACAPRSTNVPEVFPDMPDW